MDTKTFRLTEGIGVGTYGKILHGVDTITGTAVAVKKSRVSLRRRRTLLLYEAHILQLLHGHPAIPSLFGYGRFPHFEYIALDLCGKNVKELAPAPHGAHPKSVIVVAQQMISALQHVHSQGIVHRDIKPDHFLVSLHDPARLVLVDYGLSYPRNQGPDPHRYNPEKDRRGIIGTVKWASLNAHHGMHLSWRDDLESLAYALLFLLRGNLPWQDTGRHRYYTIFGTFAQVRMMKARWSGTRLAAGHSAEFGQFLDEVRSLGYDEVPPYAHYLAMFDHLYRHSGFNESDTTMDWTPAPENHAATSSATKPPPPPLTPGQLVIAAIWETPTVLAIQPNDELWEECAIPAPAPALPALVLTCETDLAGRQHATLAALRRGAAPCARRLQSGPSDDLYCYVFPVAMSCVVVENTAPVGEYCISEEELQDLLGTAILDTQVLEERDTAALAHMKCRNRFQLHVRVTPFNLLSEDLDWESTRAWFDCVIAVSQRRAADSGTPWPGTPEYDGYDDEDEDLSISYSGSDFLEWDNRQDERDATLTLSRLASVEELEVQVPRIERIIEEGR